MIHCTYTCNIVRSRDSANTSTSASSLCFIILLIPLNQQVISDNISEYRLDLARAHQQATRSPMDTAYHHLETLRKEKTYMKAGETLERRTRRLLDYWQRIAPERQMWKQHAEAFAQPRDTMTSQ